VTRNDPQNQIEFEEPTLKQARENGCFRHHTQYAGVIADPTNRGLVESRMR
jgi:hypothetical protein